MENCFLFTEETGDVRERVFQNGGCQPGERHLCKDFVQTQTTTEPLLLHERF